MSEAAEIIKQAHALVAQFEYGNAQQLLAEAVAKYPDDPDLNAETGLIYCFGQREFDAVQHLPKSVGSARHELLATTLRDYFYCRAQMAAKAGVEDEKARAPRKIVAKYATGTPEGVGIRLSACLIVKNEEKNLERCLASVKAIVDEIVVVDTGSTDRTVEIAEKFGAKIGHFEWCDDFAAARNESLRLATGDWALWIDADEELDAQGFTQIREGLMRPQFAGYYFQIINFMEAEKEANTYVHTAIRMFRLIPGVEFTGRIHEQIINGFKERGLVPATLTKGLIRHYGYQHEAMVEKNKLERTIGMLEREVEEVPHEPFHWFNLANAYSVGSMTELAESAARKCVQLIDGDAPYGPAVFQILCSSLITLKRSAEALLFNRRAVDRGYDTILNEFERAHAYFELGRYQEALESIERTMAMDWPISLTGDYGIKTYKSHVLKCQILTGLGRYDEALEAVEHSLALHPDFPMGLFAKARLLEKTGSSDEAYGLFMRCSGSPGMAPCRLMAAKLALAAGKPMDAMFAFQQAWLENRNNWEAWQGWVMACDAAGDGESLIAACEQIGEDQVQSADVLVNWGRALDRRGDAQAALAKFGAALTREPDNANAYFNCGDILYRLGNPAEAARMYEAGLHRDPQNADAWFTLGNCFVRMNIVAGAKTSYSQALVYAPDHEGAKHNLEVVSEAA